MATAHYLSDTVVAACVAWGVVAAVDGRVRSTVPATQHP
jgi:hypothetical protein